MTLDVKTDYVSSPQAAKILRITYVGVAQLARQGKIPAVKIANRWLIPRAFVEEFARTYDGKRGRPRKKRPSTVGCPVTEAAVQPTMADYVATTDVRGPGLESGEIFAVNARVANQEETPVLPTNQGELPRVGATGAGEAGEARPVVDAVSAVSAPTDQETWISVAAPRPGEPAPGDAIPVSEAAVSPGPESRELQDTSTPTGQPEETAATPPATEVETGETFTESEAANTTRPGDDTFSIRAEVYHLDKNYDFEVYEKGQITERARLIVARLKPKIPSLPHFSFRWDYRYEHLNVDIHGVEPAVMDWWTMGENGYTGHLPRRLGGPGYAFEAIVWLPVTFVFRGRLTLSLRGSPQAGEDSSSVATTTGGLRKLWAKWPTFPK
jgi:excisionase family DNA binding protein